MYYLKCITYSFIYRPSVRSWNEINIDLVMLDLITLHIYIVMWYWITSDFGLELSSFTAYVLCCFELNLSYTCDLENFQSGKSADNFSLFLSWWSDILEFFGNRLFYINAEFTSNFTIQYRKPTSRGWPLGGVKFGIGCPAALVTSPLALRAVLTAWVAIRSQKALQRAANIRQWNWRPVRSCLHFVPRSANPNAR
jgi:hypothetical protein